MLKTNRSFWLMLLLTGITFGIYPLVVHSGISTDINTIASRHDGKKTMHYCLVTFVVMPITFGIGGLVWCHNISKRIGDELMRRRLPYSFSASDFWLWCVLGSLLFFIGPAVWNYKLIKAMNLLAADYNKNG